jgi:hypothetical protein
MYLLIYTALFFSITCNFAVFSNEIETQIELVQIVKKAYFNQNDNL